MKLCPTCHRHLRTPEARCPFCGAEQRSAPALPGAGLVATALLSTLLVACTDRSPADTTGTDTSSTSSTSATTTTGVTPTTSGPTSLTGSDGSTTLPTPTTDGSVSSSDAPPLDTGDPGCFFYAGCPPDLGPEQQTLCDVFAQDCPRGEKCTAWGADSSWTGTKCVPVTGDQQPGEPCTAPQGGSAGNDDCRLGAMCWDVDGVDGTCIALCTGTPDEPVCAAKTTCIITNDDVLNLCLPTCDPLLQDCADGDVCIAVDGDFICVFEVSGESGAANESCESLNSCDPGLACVPSETASMVCLDNALISCCQPFCDLTVMDPACPNPDQVCVPWFDPMMGEVPPGMEDVGFCGLAP